MKRGKSAVKSHIDETVFIEEFADIIVEGLERQDTELEAFESYAKGIRKHIHDNMQEFSHRFARGYLLIVEELSKESDEHGPS